MTTPTRSVSELIEVWQDWTLDIQLKKRRRAWTMDDVNAKRSSPGSNWNTDNINLGGFHIGSSDEGKRNGRRRKKRERHSYDKVIRHCVSFPEDSLVRESVSVDEENDNLPDMDLSAIQDIFLDMNTTVLSMNDVNDSVFHIGCIDSDGNPLNEMSDVEPDNVETSCDTVKRKSSDEMDYSSIEKANKVANPLEVADVFGNVSMLQYDESLQMNNLSDDDLNSTKDTIISVKVPLQHQRMKTESDRDLTYAENVPDDTSEKSSQVLHSSAAAQHDTSSTTYQASTDRGVHLHEDDLNSERTSTNSLETSLDSFPNLNESNISRQEIDDQANSSAIKDKILEQQQQQQRLEDLEQSIPFQSSIDASHGSLDATSYQKPLSNCDSSSEDGAAVDKNVAKDQDGDENVDPQSVDMTQIHDTSVSSKKHKLLQESSVNSSLEGNKRTEKLILETLTPDESAMNTNTPPTTSNDEPTDTRNGNSHSSIDPAHQPQDDQPAAILETHTKNPLDSDEPRVKKQRDQSTRKERGRRRTYQIVNVEQDAAVAFSPYGPSSQVSTERSNAKIRNEGHNNERGCDKSELQLTSDELVESSIFYTTDPILGQYTGKMNSAKEFYTRTQPFRIGERSLPLNQIEVVLRRRAIKKREAVQVAATSSRASVEERPIGSSKSNTFTAVASGRVPKTPVEHHNIPRPPSRESQSSAPRRTLFPNFSGHSRNHSLGMDTTYEDDSTISSATVASTWTAGNTSSAYSLNNATILQSGDLSGIQEMPQEEIIGDTSLGLKLTILHGKVIVQAISPLEDGRASPAQLCGLFYPGDILIAVNDSFLINNGNIHSPVPMDKMIEALKPLSEAIEGNGCYSREVRLRFVVNEGKKLLREQKEREEKKQRLIQERKKLGLDGKAGAASIDHAADIFGLSALMGVDQHTGMPMFQDIHLETHHDESMNEMPQHETSADDKLAADGERDRLPAPDTSYKHLHDSHSLSTKASPTIQSRISNQLAKERQLMRDRNCSGFFALDSGACVLLRAPSPPTMDLSVEYPELNPIERRLKKLELGTSNISHAKELVSQVEQQERLLDAHDDEDPLEVASRICGTASIRTGASRRRWHRGDSVIKEESTVVSASSTENQADANTVESEESVEICDHQMLVDLAANHQSWKRNVIKRLGDYAIDTEKAIKKEISSEQTENTINAENGTRSSLDSLLFGSDVARMLEKKKNSLALPPGEMTQMLFDLKEHLIGGLPGHIFTNHDPLIANVPEKSVTFLRPPNTNIEDISKATDYLLNEALVVWLKSFRPLPWKQRRALWPIQLQASNNESSSMMSSHFDDGMSLSMASGGTQSAAKTEKRNLREIIEELELDPETRRETCNLVTFYFTHNCLKNGQTRLSEEDEKAALDFVDTFGSYLDLYNTLVVSGNIESQPLAHKLVSLAKFDPQHREAMKGLQNAKILLFYEPNMLSALHELLQTGAYNTMSAHVDMTRLLVSAYPDLPPIRVKNASIEDSTDFYFKYLTLLMHPDEGSDAAKGSNRLVKEWCLLLCASIESHDDTSEESMLSFHRVASAPEGFSSLYNRDLSFLLDISINIAEYKLALDIAKEIVTRSSKMQNLSLKDLLRHLSHISSIAIEGEFDSQLLGEVVAFYTDVSAKPSQWVGEFDIVNELTNIFEKCIDKNENNSSSAKSNDVNTCLRLLSENTTPLDGLKVLSRLELSDADQSAKVSALHTLLIRGASKSVDKELSASLLRIQRVREDNQLFSLEESMSVYNFDENDAAVDEEESNGFIWPNILDGRMIISNMALSSDQDLSPCCGHVVQASSDAVNVIRIENRLLEQYLQEKGVNLPDDWTSIETHHNDSASNATPIEVKLQLAIESLSKTNNILENRKEASNKLISTIKVMLAEVDLRIADIQRDAHNFKRDVVDGGRCIHNPDKYKAKKMVRYFDGKFYDQESSLDKLKLLNSTFLNRKRRLESQLNQKEDLSLHFIDYHEMQIKQKQNKKLLTDKSAAATMRKIATEKAKQSILSLQSELKVLKSKAASNKKKLELRDKYSLRLEETIQAKLEEVKVQKNVLENRDPSSNSDSNESGPDIMQYIGQKAKIYELRESIKTMERKIEIAKGNLKTSRCQEVGVNESFHWQPGML